MNNKNDKKNQTTSQQNTSEKNTNEKNDSVNKNCR